MYQHCTTATLYPIYLSYFATWPLLSISAAMPCSKLWRDSLDMWETLWTKPESFSSPFLRFIKINSILILSFWKRPLVLYLVPGTPAPQALAQPAAWDWEEELRVSCPPSTQSPLEDGPAGDWLQFREPLGLWGLSDFHSLREIG